MRVGGLVFKLWLGSSAEKFGSIRVCCRPKGGTATFTFMLIYVREACHFNVSEAKRLEFCDTD